MTPPRFDAMGAFWLVNLEANRRAQREVIIRMANLALYGDRWVPRPEKRRHGDRRFKAALRVVKAEWARLLGEKPPQAYELRGVSIS